MVIESNRTVALTVGRILKFLKLMLVNKGLFIKT